jgi:hypothetical protein
MSITTGAYALKKVDFKSEYLVHEECIFQTKHKI